MSTAERGQLRTVAEVARDLQVSPMTVRRRIADGSLPALRIGRDGPVRISQRAVDELLKPTESDDGLEG